MYLDFNELAPAQRYFAMVQTIIPRPIAWVLSDNGAGEGEARYNLAPFSFFTGICSDPPLLLISVGKKPSGEEAGQLKDTRRNVSERKHFVVHIASADHMQTLNQTAATLLHGDSELVQEGLGTMEFPGFALPRLRDCPVAFGCSLYRMDEIGNTPQAIIYGQIEQCYVADDLIVPHDSRLVIDAKKLDPLARLGGNDYSSLGELMSVSRPK